MQDMIDYLRYKELTANYSIAQSEVDNLAQAINRNGGNKISRNLNSVLNANNS